MTCFVGDCRHPLRFRLRDVKGAGGGGGFWNPLPGSSGGFGGSLFARCSNVRLDAAAVLLIFGGAGIDFMLIFIETVFGVGGLASAGD